MIPSFKPGILSSNIIRAAGGGGGGSDVTPNAVNWIESTSNSLVATSNQQTITGINTTITLRIELSNSLEFGEVASYIKNSGSAIDVQNPAAIPSVEYADVSIVNGDILEFRLDGTGNSQQGIFNITNLSDGNTLLDTVTLNVLGV